MRAHRTCIGLIAVGCVLTLSTTAGSAPMPTPFTKNMGQWDDRVLFRTVSGGATIWLCRDGITYQFTHRTRPEGPDEFTLRDRLNIPKVQSAIVHAKFVNPSVTLGVVGEGELGYKCNYFFGNDPSRWRTDVPNYAAVVYREVYRGIDLRLSAPDGRLGVEWVSAPGAELPSDLFTFTGDGVTEGAADDDVIVSIPWGATRALPGITRNAGCPGGTLATHSTASQSSPSAVSVIYSSPFGGSFLDEGRDLAIDAAGNAYVTGWTWSDDFPTENPYQDSTYDRSVFVTKINATGDALVYSTYLGGFMYFSEEEGNAVAIDSNGCAYVTGWTFSTDFPTVNPLQDSLGGSYDCFLTKLSPQGNELQYSTYLGGTDYENARDIAVDADGFIHVTGETYSEDFPVFSAVQPAFAGGIDGFVSKTMPSGTALVFSTYFGGTGGDLPNSIALDETGSIYFTGETTSFDYPVINPVHPTNSGELDIFVTKLSSDGSQIEYSTYIGGGLTERGQAIAVDQWGCAHVAGWTNSTDFPTTGPIQGKLNNADAIAFRLSSTGESVLFSTYLGGNNGDYGWGIATDDLGHTYVAGWTYSVDFPLLGSYQPHQGTADVFVTKVAGDGSAILASTYFGGVGIDEAHGIAVDSAGRVFISGSTTSVDFLNTGLIGLGDDDDAFIAKLDFCSCPNQSDLNEDTFVDAVDLALVIDIVFFGGAEMNDAICPATRADFNADGLTDAVDLAFLIDHVFFGGPGPVDPCP